jgi:epoxyqueuosine reductase
MPEARTTAEFAPDARLRDREVGELLSLDEPAFRALTEGSPLARARRSGFIRNALVVIANRKSKEHLEAVRACASSDPDPMVRETAAWALAKLETE